jgi:hypothetical protein
MATASPWDDGHALPHWLSLGHLLLQAVLNAGGGSEQVRRGDRFHKVVPWRATAAGTAERPATARNRTHRRRTARRSTMLRGWALIEGLLLRP